MRLFELRKDAPGAGRIKVMYDGVEVEWERVTFAVETDAPEARLRGSDTVLPGIEFHPTPKT